MVDIKGLDKAEILKALFDTSHIQSVTGSSLIPEGGVTVEHCRELLKRTTHFDYLYSWLIKVDLSSDDAFDERVYDLRNGLGSAERAIAPLRAKTN